MKKLNNLIRIILICIIFIIGIVTYNSFFKHHKYVNKAEENYVKQKIEAKKIITSYDVIDKMKASVLKEISVQKEKIELGLSKDDDTLKLLEYKSDAYTFLEGWHSDIISRYEFDCPSTPCFYSCILNNSTEVTQDMFDENGMIRSSRLIELYIKLNNLYKNGSLTKDEFESKKREYIEYNDKLIKIAQNIEKATSIQNLNNCCKCQNQINMANPPKSDNNNLTTNFENIEAELNNLVESFKNGSKEDNDKKFVDFYKKLQEKSINIRTYTINNVTYFYEKEELLKELKKENIEFSDNKKQEEITISKYPIYKFGYYEFASGFEINYEYLISQFTPYLSEQWISYLLLMKEQILDIHKLQPNADDVDPSFCMKWKNKLETFLTTYPDFYLKNEINYEIEGLHENLKLIGLE